MKTAFLTATLLVCAQAAQPSKPNLDDKMLIGPAPIQWLKVYPLSPYKEHWTLQVEVKNLSKALPKVLKILEKAGGALTQPLEQFPASPTAGTQQLSYKVGLRGARQALKELKRVGSFRAPVVRPSFEPVSLPEVKEKLRRLRQERGAYVKELAAMPSISALAEELINHLEMVESVREKEDAEVLLNMTVQERR